MKSLLDNINESIARANPGIRRKIWETSFYQNTQEKWVDLLEINGSGVVDYLYANCESSTSNCSFRLTFDDTVWEWNCGSSGTRTFLSENMIFGALYTDSYYRLMLPYKNELTYGTQNDIHIIGSDFEQNKLALYNILPGGFKFNKHFKLSVSTTYAYGVNGFAHYGLY